MHKKSALKKYLQEQHGDQLLEAPNVNPEIIPNAAIDHPLEAPNVNPEIIPNAAIDQPLEAPNVNSEITNAAGDHPLEITDVSVNVHMLNASNKKRSLEAGEDDSDYEPNKRGRNDDVGSSQESKDADSDTDALQESKSADADTTGGSKAGSLYSDEQSDGLEYAIDKYSKRGFKIGAEMWKAIRLDSDYSTLLKGRTDSSFRNRHKYNIDKGKIPIKKEKVGKQKEKAEEHKKEVVKETKNPENAELDMAAITKIIKRVVQEENKRNEEKVEKENENSEKNGLDIAAVRKVIQEEIKINQSAIAKEVASSVVNTLTPEFEGTIDKAVNKTLGSFFTSLSKVYSEK